MADPKSPFGVDEIRSGSEGVPRARLRLADRRQQPGPAPITTITTNDDDIIESTTPTPQTNNKFAVDNSSTDATQPPIPTSSVPRLAAQQRTRSPSRALRLTNEPSTVSMEISPDPLTPTPTSATPFRRRQLQSPPTEPPTKNKKPIDRMRSAVTAIEAQSALRERGRQRQRDREQEKQKELEDLQSLCHDTEISLIRFDVLPGLEELAGRMKEATVPAVDWTRPQPVAAEFLAALNRIYFYPSEFQEKQRFISGALVARQIMEEDGLYVPPTNPISWSSYLRMDDRIRRSDPESYHRWMDRDGRLKVNPDAFVQRWTRRPHVYQMIEHIEDDPGSSIEPRPTKPRVIDMTVDENAGIHDLVYRHRPNMDQDYQQEGTLSRLVISLNAIQFLDHPLMSEEGRLSAQIMVMADELERRRRTDRQGSLEQRLLVMREEYLNFKEKFVRQTEADSFYLDQESFEERCLKIMNSIQEIQTWFENESKETRLLQWQIFKVWERLKAVRNSQKFNSTPLKVVIKKEDTDKQKEQQKLEAYIQMALHDMEEIHQLKHRIGLRQYECAMEEWLKTQEGRSESDLAGKKSNEDLAEETIASQAGLALETPSGRRRHRKKSQFDGQENAEPNDLPAKPVEISPTKKRRHRIGGSKPLSPTYEEFDGSAARRALEKRLDSCFRKPGTPILTAVVTQSESITSFNSCPKIEQGRRSQISNHSIFIKILVNKRDAMKSTYMKLNFENLATFFQNSEYGIFTIQTHETPRSVVMEIWERSGYHSTKISDVNLELPDVAKHIESIDQELQLIEFKGNSIPENHGATIDFYKQLHHSEKNADDRRVILGLVTTKLAWDSDESGNIFAPKYITRSSTKVPRSDSLDMKFFGLLSSKNGGPESVKMMDANEINIFRLNPYENALRIGDPSLSKRNQLLLLRHQDKIVLKQPIPLNDHDISKDCFQLKDTFSDVKSQFDLILSHVEQKSSPVLAISPMTPRHGQSISIFLKRIRTHEMYSNIRAQHMRRPVTFEEFVREEKVAEDVEGSIFDVLLMPARPLRPLRSNRGAKLIPIPNECNIVIQILSGFNIPFRTSGRGVREKQQNRVGDFLGPDEDEEEEKRRKELDRRRKATVRPYVEVQFQRKRERTTVAVGSNPHWNETLILPFHPLNGDFKSESLLNVRDSIFINLFDEFTVNLNIDDRDRDRHVHQRIERNWLGTVTIPFATIYENMMMDGKFHLQTPVILNGYQKTLDNDLDKNNTETMISLFMTLEPALPPASLLKPKFDSYEEPDLIDLIGKWQKSILPADRQDKITATTIDMSGKTVLITRFIRPQAPPSELDSAEKIVAFVATIPYIGDRTVISTSVDFWGTTEQLLEIGAGDECEHAIVLCNYFLHMKLKAWVILGRGIPEGKTAYTLVEYKSSLNTLRRNGSTQGLFQNLVAKKETNSKRYYLYNPLSGIRYLPEDLHCSLTEVYCIFNGENVWANIQKTTKPSKLDFNLGNQLAWKPLFLSSTGVLGNIQSEFISYKTVEDADCRELEREITNSLVSKIEKWRGRFVTRWNRTLSRAMDKILPKLELDRQGVAVDLDTAYTDVKKLENVYRIRGFPLNFPYTDIDTAVEILFNTDVHSNEDTAAEFALAVYVHPFVNNIFSVWVYVASLTREHSFNSIPAPSKTDLGSSSTRKLTARS